MTSTPGDRATSEVPASSTHLSNLEVSDPGLMTSQVPPGRTSATGRYVLTAFHARGGMGEVWRCHDANIGREVALKRLVADRTSARERFLCEAQITGQLEHPSIVPVHDLGFDDNGQPFYVMKLVRGSTLKATIDAYHNPTEALGKSQPREVARVRLLKIFLDLCNAVAYAHSRGVIHRDLKPDNVMLGEYGETVLLDWGLAKVSGQKEDTATGLSSTSPTISGTTAQTEDGSVIGSPLYMPPEMAEGRLTDIDQRTDVYLLGATLYEILTGRPPRQGSSRQEILELARTAPPTPPRKLVPDTPRALEAICIKAMSRTRQSRYEGAMALAEDIQRFIAGEPVSAYREPRRVRAWRWAKRHRRSIARGAIAAAFVALVAVSAGIYRDAAGARLREKARAQVADVRRLIDEAQFYAASIDDPGERAPYYDPTRGEQAANAALETARQWGPKLENLPLVDQRDSLRLELADVCLLLAQLRLGTAPSRGSGSALQAEVPALLDRADALAEIASRGSHRLRAQYFRATGQADRAVVEEQAATAEGTPVRGQDLFLEGESIRIYSMSAVVVDARDAAGRQKHHDALAPALVCYQAALEKEPTHYWSRLQLGRCYLALGRGSEAVEALGACVALRPDAPWGYSVRGLTLAMMRRFDDAKANLDRAVALDPQCVSARLNRATLYVMQNRPTEAAAELNALVSRANPPAEAVFARGQLLLLTGEPSTALASFDDALRIQTKLAPAHLLRARAHLELGENASAIRNLDEFFIATGNLPPDSAAAAAQRGHVLRIIASQLSPSGRKHAFEAGLAELKTATASSSASSVAFADLGGLLALRQDFQEAAQAFTRAIELAPNEPQLRINRGLQWINLNHDREAQEDLSAALKLAPNNVEALSLLGYVEARQNRHPDAERHASLALLGGSDDYMILHNVACIYAELSRADNARRAEREDAALAMLERAISLWRQAQGGPDEMQLIQNESAFSVAFRQRPQFQRLISG